MRAYENKEKRLELETKESQEHFIKFKTIYGKYTGCIIKIRTNSN